MGGMPHFAKADIACGRAMIKPDEAIRLKRLAERDGLLVAQSAVADCVIKPDIFNRAVLRQQFLELRFLHLRIVAAVGLVAPPPGLSGQAHSPSEK